MVLVFNKKEVVDLGWIQRQGLGIGRQKGFGADLGFFLLGFEKSY